MRKGWNDFNSETKCPRILDCGANIGISVLNYKRHYPDARITVFEPDPHIAPVLRRNLRTNNAADVEVIEGAVWTSDGKADFFCEGAEGSSLVHRVASQPVQVETVDLRRFLSDKIDLLKMDIEGAECKVIPAIADKLTLVRNLIVECHIANSDINPFSDLLRALGSSGFNVSVNSYLWWRDLIRKPRQLPNEFDQYMLVAAWRDVATT